MSYIPTNWSTGDIVTAEKLNKMEQGIANVGSGSSAGEGTLVVTFSPIDDLDDYEKWRFAYADVTINEFISAIQSKRPIEIYIQGYARSVDSNIGETTCVYNTLEKCNFIWDYRTQRLMLITYLALESEDSCASTIIHSAQGKDVWVDDNTNKMYIIAVEEPQVTTGV